MIIASDIVALVLLGLILFVGAKIIGRQILAAQSWSEPDTDPCEHCLRWGECHGVDVDNCPHFTDWRG